MLTQNMLQGQVALVTGGTKGIGRGIVEAFLAHGAHVVVNGRSQEKGQQAIKEMNAGDAALFVAGDVQVQSDVEHLVSSTIDHFGKIDILVNNAGGSSGFAPVAELTDEAWQEAAAWTLHSAFWATRAALQDMQKRKHGRIINISSTGGTRADKAAIAHYITFKHALNGLTKAVAFEYGAMGITCNAIGPGGVETDLMMEGGPAAAKSMGITYEELINSYAEESPIKRLNTAEEIADTALFLASKSGGGLNGAIVPVDGGATL